MNSNTQFKNHLTGVGRELVNQMPASVCSSENLIENVRQLLSEIKLLQIELAQAEKNLAASSALLCEAIYADIEARGFSKIKHSSVFIESSTENAPVFSQVM